MSFMTDDVKDNNSSDNKENLPADQVEIKKPVVANAEPLEQDETVDLAQEETIAFYGDGPLRGPAWAQEAVEQRAAFAQRIPGTSEWTIGNGVGSLSQLTAQERAEQEDEEALEDFRDTIEIVKEEQERREEREREEWSRSMHSYAGMEMTGEEWGKFADELKGDTQLRKWLLEKLKKDGKTDEQARTMADQMALLAKMQSLPPSQWTPEMKAFNSKLDADPALRQELNKDLKEAREAERGLSLNKQDIAQSNAIERTGTDHSVASGDETLSQSLGKAVGPVSQQPSSYASSIGEAGIKSLIQLTEHHQAALQAVEPLDAPKQVAAFTPPPAPTSPGAGFDA